jgi:signal transduction histidine kinase
VPQLTTRATQTNDAFIRHVGHDLRSALNAVVAWGELVRSGQLPPEELTRAGDTIVRQARQLSRRLNDALDLWRLDVDALTVTPAASSVAAAVRSAIESSRPQFESRRVECHMALQDDSAVDVDTVRLSQALTLLLVDAAFNTPAGESVEITLTNHEGGLAVMIAGGGRAPADGAFDRDPAETSPNGTRPFDFGLPLARELVERNHGTLAVEAGAEGRVSFVVRLPTS